VSEPRYYVTTWDGERQAFTPQKGVRAGPYSKFGLRKALRRLQAMGYGITRSRAPCVRVETAEEYHAD